MQRKLMIPDGWQAYLAKALPGLAAILVLAEYTPLLSVSLSAANFGLDGGDLVTAALTGGVAHPSGYPTYLVLLRIFLSFPWISSYWGASFFSVCVAAAAAALVLIYSWDEESGLADRALAMVGVLGLSGAVLFASQSVIAEVNGLNTLFVLAVLGWALEISRLNPAKNSRLKLFLLAFTAGLGLGNHLILIFSLPLVLFELGKLIRRKGSARLVWIQAAGFFCGLLVYLYLPLSARLYPPVNWGNPQTLGGFWWDVSGAPYQGLLASLPLEIIGGRLLLILRMLVDQFTPLGVGLAGIGLFSLPASLKYKTGWIFILYCLFSAGYNTRDSVVYLLPAWAMTGIWIGRGAAQAVKFQWKGWGLGIVLVGLTVAWLVVNTAGTWPRIDPRRDQSTASYLAAIAGLPDGAFLFTVSDAETFPAWYFHFGLHQRSDLRVVVLPLTRYGWYQETLGHGYPDLARPAVKEWAAGDWLWGEDLANLSPGRIVCRTKVEGDNQQRLSLRCGNSVVFSGELLKDSGW